MIKVFIYSCLLLVFLINCKSNIPEARNKTDYSQITHYSSRSAHPISSVNFDTIRIDAGNENEMTSLLGSFLLTGRSDVVSLLEKAGLSSHIPGIEKRVVAERGYGAPLFLPHLFH